MAKKKIAYTTSRLNRNLESVTANDSKNRRASERSLSSAFKWGIFVAGLLFADD